MSNHFNFNFIVYMATTRKRQNGDERRAAKKVVPIVLRGQPIILSHDLGSKAW